MNPSPTVHRCCMCHEIKPLEDFLKDHARKSGRGYRCYSCNKVYQARRNERIRQIVREHQAGNPLRDRLALAALAGLAGDRAPAAIAEAYKIADATTQARDARRCNHSCQ